MLRTVALFVLASWIFVPTSFAAPSAALSKAKKDAEARGFIFETSHDEIVAKAKKEGKLNVLSGLQPASYPDMMNTFRKRYPFIEISMQEITGVEAARRYLLEVKAGRGREFDLVSVNAVLYNEYPPHAKKFDILSMGEHRVVRIPPRMVAPESRTIVAVAHGLSVVVYNNKLISTDKVPDRWEDFLRPELKGRKFVVDVEPRIFSVFASCPEQGMGLQWMIDYARKIRAQEPIWVRGHTRGLTAMLAGEYALHHGTNYHSTMRLKGKRDPLDLLQVKILEPAPLRLAHEQMILEGASHPYAALLFIEHQASLEGQKLLDKHEPFQSSIYTRGSALNEAVGGKKVCINDFDTFTKSDDWMKEAVKAFGFPQPEKERK